MWNLIRFNSFAVGLAAVFFVLTGCTSVNSKVGGVFNLNTDLKLEIEALTDSSHD